MSDDTMITKPGIKTTEFWLSAAACVIGGVTVSGAFCGADASSWQHTVCKVAGLAATVLGAFGYSCSRAWTKAA